jgi:hypothetical protein
MISVTAGCNYSGANLPPGPAAEAENIIEEIHAVAVHSEVEIENPTIEIDVFNAPFLGSHWPTPNWMSQRAATGGVLFQDTLEMDIDQDWNWMLT